MKHPSNDLAATYVRLAESVAQTEGGIEPFMRALRRVFDIVHADLSGKNGKSCYAAFRQAMVASRGDYRKLSVLNQCAWPLFDKVPVPGENGAAASHFLWVFALPFVVTFAREQLDGEIITFEGDVLDVGLLLDMTELTGAVAPGLQLRGFDMLYRREDFHRLGAASLADSALRGELELSGDCPRPLPHAFDEDMDAWRTVTFHVLCSALAPVGSRDLLQRDRPWPDEQAARVVRHGLEARGLKIESVHSLPPCTLGETQFQCNGAGLVEIQQNLLNAKKEYGQLSVVIRHPANGIAEVNGVNSEGQELILIPSFTFFEPRWELDRTIKEAALAAGHLYQGSASATILGPATLH